MSNELLGGRVTAFLGCTDEGQFEDLFRCVHDGAAVAIIPGPRQFLQLGDEVDAREASVWCFAMDLAAAVPDQISVREPPEPRDGYRGWWFSSVSEYMAWALAGFDHLDLLCVGSEISERSVEEQGWDIHVWLEWLEEHGGGEFLTYDSAGRKDAPVWLQVRAALKSGVVDGITARVGTATGPRDHDMGTGNWMAFTEGWDEIGDYDDPDPDLGLRPSPLTVLDARYGRYADDDPGGSLPAFVSERLASGADELADQVWRPIRGFSAAEIVGIGDEAHLPMAKAARGDLHQAVAADGCFLLPFAAGDTTEPAVNGLRESRFALFVVAPGHGTTLTMHTVSDGAEHITAIRAAAGFSHVGSRWPWRQVGTLAIPSGQCAMWFPWQHHLYSDGLQVIAVVPGRYVFEVQTPGAWRIRLKVGGSNSRAQLP